MRRAVSLLLVLFLLAFSQAGPAPLGPAQSLLAQGDAPGAVGLLEEIVAGEPDHAQAWLLLGTARQRSGDLEGALAAALRAREIGGVGPQGTVRLALVHGARGELDRAFELLAEVRAGGAFDLTTIAVNPDAAPLREDGRWRELFPSEEELADPFVESARVLGEWRGDVVGGQFGWIARTIGDVDADGVLDFTTSAPTDGRGGTVFAYSSAGGELLWSVSGTAGDQLGSGLEAAGDADGDGVPDVVAGAPVGNYALLLSGRDGRVLQRLEAAAEAEAFGTQVADIGDANRDGYDDVAVGAPTADHAGDDSGRVYVFSGRDGSLLWSADGLAAGERLGSTVGGGTRDGVTWILGGADQGPSAGGRAYVWRGLTAMPAYVVEGEPSARAMGGMFASMPGDVDGDGAPELYVSDWADATSGPATGRIYVISTLTGEVVRTLAGEAAGDGFGIGPADTGDVDRDGHDDLIVGAWQHASAAPGGGKVYLYSGATGEVLWSLTGKVMGETFGFDATGIGDVDGDGAIDFLLTSAWSSVNGSRTGRVWIVAGPRFTDDDA